MNYPNTLRKLAALLVLCTAEPIAARDVITAPLDPAVHRLTSSPLLYPSITYRNEFHAVPGGVYHLFEDGIHGWSWYFSDGSPTGTRFVCNIPSLDAIVRNNGLQVAQAPLGALGAAEGSEYFRITGGNSPSVQILPATASPGRRLWEIFGANAGGVFTGHSTYQEDGFGSGTPQIWYSADAESEATPLLLVDEDVEHRWMTPAGRLYATGERNGERGLWTSDGTVAGTVKLPIPWYEVIRPHAGAYQGFAPAVPYTNGITWFQTTQSAWDPVLGYRRENAKLWRSDGTPAGTFAITLPGWSGSNALQIISLGDHTLWAAAVEPGILGVGARSVIYMSDGTQAGTSKVDAFENPATGWGLMREAGGRCLLRNGSDVWSSDGTAAGTVLMGSMPEPGWTIAPEYNGWTYLAARQGATILLMRTNGSVLENFTTLTPWAIRNAGIANGYLFFTMEDTSKDQTLWRTDGTVGGTILLRKFPRIAAFKMPSVQTGPEAFAFKSYYGVGNADERIWRSDGAPGSAAVLTSTVPGGAGFRLPRGNYRSSDGHLALVEYSSGSIRMSTWRPASGFEMINGGALWTDGGLIFRNDKNFFFRFTEGGTYGSPFDLITLRPDGWLYPQHHSAGIPSPLSDSGSRNFFRQASTAFTNNIFSSDGTPAGSYLLGDPALAIWIWSNLQMYPVSETDVAIVAGQSLYTASGAAVTRQAGVEFPDRLVTAGGILYFTSINVASGMELWKWQPGSAPVMVKDIDPGPGSSCPSQLRAVGDKLCFSANDGTHGYEPWMSDGTAAGTQMIADLRTGTLGSDPSEFTAAGSYTVFTANDGVTGRELWQSRGTAASTRVSETVPGADTGWPQDLHQWNDAVIHTTGTGQVAVFTPDPTPGWAAWSAVHLANVGTVVGSPRGDADADGADNFAEYAFGPEPGLTATAAPAGCLGFALPARQDTAVEYSIECSADMVTWAKWRFRWSCSAWQAISPGLTIQAGAAASGMSALTLCIPVPATPRCFSRVSVAAD
jgi:ELWxxDGT repeat protein